MTESLTVLGDRLTRWLVGSAYPLWSTRGVDERGGFVERLDPAGKPLAEDRRARVTPRQLYAFTLAPDFGWTGDAETLVRRGLLAFQTRYQRPDGLYRTLVSADGVVRDERALLYDQAFVLLGLAATFSMLGRPPELEHHAQRMRRTIAIEYRMPGGDFRSGDPTHDLREINPHMHLLEACLAWAEISSDAAWQRCADEIVELALRRFIDSRTGAMVEAFTPTWAPAPGPLGRRVEPGHQFEWAWLLLRWTSRSPHAPRHEDARRAAFDLIEIGERFGVQAGFAVNALLDDLTVHDAEARLWPQTERLKAALLAAKLTNEPAYRQIAASAANALAQYLGTPVAGLWFDRHLPSGEWRVEPSPASSFYHIAGAIHALGRMS